MSKLAIVFGDINYSTEAPLFYYSKQLLQKHGFETLDFHYELHNPKKYTEIFKTKPDSESQKFKQEILEYVAEAQAAGKPVLSADLAGKYEEVVFVSKGVGSIIAALIAKKNGLKLEHIMFAPLEPAFQFVSNEEGLVLCGDRDDYIKYDRLKEFCRKTNLSVYHYEKCNHSLDSGDVEMNLGNLGRFLKLIDLFLEHGDKTVYDFDVLNMDMESEKLSKYQGQVLLIVNTATGCGFTPQYTKLEEIYESFHKQGFNLLDFPCNQFANQAPGSDKEIHSFCESRYAIRFPQYAKIKVNGPDESPLYTYLKARRGFGGFDLTTLDGQYLDKKTRADFPDYETSSDIKWNFTKFLIDRKGRVVERYEPTTDLEIIKKDIERLLAE